MPKTEKLTPYDEVLLLERNDVQGAVALYTKLVKEGRLEDGIGESLAMLFDDPEVFLDALDAAGAPEAPAAND